ncbi:MAG: hypothetical protein ACI89L_000782 [Phycisphaerales bacterium]|jgi:hypothetical protein
MKRTLIVSALGLTTAAATAQTPYLEDFNNGAAGWTDVSSNPIGWVGSGALDGSAYVQAEFDINNADPTFGALLFRIENGASGGNFAGDFLAGGITGFRFDVYQDSGVDLNYSVRVSTNPFPAFVMVNPNPVASGQWTTIEILLDPNSPWYFSENPVDPNVYNTVMSSVAKMQIAILRPGGITEATPTTFSVDNFATIPTPASAALLGLGGLVATRRRR